MRMIVADDEAVGFIRIQSGRTRFLLKWESHMSHKSNLINNFLFKWKTPA